MERELALARQSKATLLKLVHGYGSTGTGGDIRIAVQKRLVEMAQNGQIRGCIFGENWSKSDDAAWKLLQSQPELKGDSDLGRRIAESPSFYSRVIGGSSVHGQRAAYFLL